MLYIKTRSRAETKDLIRYMANKLNATLGQSGSLMLLPYLRHVDTMRRSLCYVAFDDHDNDMSALASRQNVPESWSHFLTVAQFKAKMAEPRPPFTKAEPAFDLGFEIEGCVVDDARAELVAYLSDLYPGVHTDHLIHADRSIRPLCRAIEIVTPPLPSDEATERLEWLLGTLSIMSSEGWFETNATCGLHVNLSERQLFSAAPRAIRERFAYTFLRAFDPVKWQRAFRRTGNRYCWWAGPPRSIKDLMRDGAVRKAARSLGVRPDRARHWSAINTEHLNVGNAARRRIEVRVAGGPGYHAKHERLAEYLLDIERAALQAHYSI